MVIIILSYRVGFGGLHNQTQSALFWNLPGQSALALGHSGPTREGLREVYISWGCQTIAPQLKPKTLTTTSGQMSLSRNFFREFRPLFRMLEDPFFGRAPVAYNARGHSVFDDPFLGLARSGLRPAVDVAEEGNSYIIEAELPGVRKEDINVEIGDNGRSVTIQGNIVRRPRQQEQPTVETSANGEVQEGKHPSRNNLIRARFLTTLPLAASPESSKISVERESTGHTTFTRSITLPTQVDAGKVSAKLVDGVLTLTVPKAEDAGRVKIDIE